MFAEPEEFEEDAYFFMIKCPVSHNYTQRQIIEEYLNMTGQKKDCKLVDASQSQ